MAILSKIKTKIYSRIAYFIHYGCYNCSFSRKKTIKKQIDDKSNYLKPLDREQKDAILKMWRSRHVINNNDWKFYEFYNYLRSDDIPIEYYIPDSFWYITFDLQLTNPRESYIIDDKNMYDLYFNDVKRPRTICRVIEGVVQNSKFELIDIDSAVQLCKQQKSVIIKQSRSSEGGKNIKFWNIDKNDVEELKTFLSSTPNLVIQEVVKQHDELSSLHKESLNTIRIMTLFINHEIKVLSAVVRMGVGDSKVDNASSGGIVCGICQNGRLKNFACNAKGDIIKDFHPQGCRFENIFIPNYSSCISLVKSLALRMSGYSSLISWDLAIDCNGQPVLIECNLTFGQLDFHQICNGPILGVNDDFIKIIFDYVQDLKKSRIPKLNIIRF